MKRYLALLFALVVIAAVIPATQAAFSIDPEGDYRPGNECTNGSITVYNQTNVTWSGATIKVWHGSCTAGVRGGGGLESFGASGTYTLHYVVGSPLTFIEDDGGTGAYNYFIYNSTEAPVVPLNVDFVGTPTSGSIPLGVSFTATNLSNTTGITWTFGDGNITTASGISIYHSYPNPGIYSVSMEYSNGTSRETIIKPNYISASAGNKTVYLQLMDERGNISSSVTDTINLLAP